VLAPLGPRLAPEKTTVVHIDEGFDFPGFHIRRTRKRGTSKYYVYTKPCGRGLRETDRRQRQHRARRPTSPQLAVNAGSSWSLGQHSCALTSGFPLERAKERAKGIEPS
jgi:hypothetical protein